MWRGALWWVQLVKDKDAKSSVSVGDVQSALRLGADLRFKGAVQSVMVGLKAQKWREQTPEDRQASSVCSIM